MTRTCETCVHFRLGWSQTCSVPPVRTYYNHGSCNAPIPQWVTTSPSDNYDLIPKNEPANQCQAYELQH